MKIRETYFLLALVLVLASRSSSLTAQVMINEFSCSNLSQYIDNHSDYNDWIELYNAGGAPVNLTGYYLSDDSLNKVKWPIPSGITIPANGFLRFWASGRNEVVGSSYHTNFTLKQTKNSHEWVVLSNPATAIVDSIKILRHTQLGHSYGRTLNGGPAWRIFTNPTPNSSNNFSTSYITYADKPDFSLVAGFYASGQVITITTTEPNSTIRYTLDGTLPTTFSPAYTTPFLVSATTVVKAITISTNPSVLPSFIEFETYFINVSHTLPVVSIAGTQLTTLANGNNTLKPHGTFEYFDINKVRTANTYGEFNSHGQDSWANSQRSLDFVSRDEMGYNHSIEEVLFNTSPRNNYQRIILRAAGDDNYPADHNVSNLGSAHVRDAFIHNLALHGGLNLDVRRGSKCVVYLNGQYWGVYDLRDNPDDHDNTNYYYGQDKHHLYFIETWGTTWAEYGGPAALSDWSSLRSYILNNNMATASNYQYVTDRLDVSSLVDYVCVNMFTVCSDWLNWNTAWWRGTDPAGTHLKWGYTLWDNDATFGHYINYTGIPNTSPTASPCDPEKLNGTSDPEDHIGILVKLRTNPDFNQYYISRQIDLWNTVFSCNNMIHELDSTVNLISPEMTQHAARWSGTLSEWQGNVQLLRNFINQRCTSLTAGWINCYNLKGPYNLTLRTDPAGSGSVQINSLLVNQLPWTRTYFGGIDTKLNVLPNTNFTFTNWSAKNQTFTPNVNASSVKVNLSSADTITAHFIPTGISELLPLSEPIVSAFPTVTNNVLTIQYSLHEPMAVSMKLYSILGTELVEIKNPQEIVPPGNHVAEINLAGSNLPGGIYMLDFKTGNFRKCIKLIYSPQ